MPVANNPQANMTRGLMMSMPGAYSMQVREREVNQVENLLVGMGLKRRADGMGTSRYQPPTKKSRGVQGVSSTIHG